MSRTARRIIASAVVTALLSIGGVALAGASQEMDDTMSTRTGRTEAVLQRDR